MISKAVAAMIQDRKAIDKVSQIKENVKNDEDVEVKAWAVRKVLKEQLHLSYRQPKKIPMQANLQRCKVLRQ